MRNHIVIPAAGNGFRFGAARPKQYSLLLGKPVLQHVIDRLAQCFEAHAIYVVLAIEDHWFDDVIERRAGVTALRRGRATRAMSVRNALEALTGAGQAPLRPQTPGGRPGRRRARAAGAAAMPGRRTGARHRGR